VPRAEAGATLPAYVGRTGSDQLWLVVGAPPEVASTLELTPEDLEWTYPDGPKALPPELER
jgi:hypothetical protein